jgi:glutathione S-transferase
LPEIQRHSGDFVKLYINERSGNSYKPRLLLSMLGVPCETVAIDLAKREQKRPEFLKINPRGQVPALEDAGTVIWDSTAILVYLARKYGSDAWFPVEPEPMAKVMQWLAFAQNEIHYGLQFARAIQHFGRRGDLDECRAYGRTALAVLQGHLENHSWLALERMTIADIACFPYVAMAPDADIVLDEYPAIVAWIDRIKAQPGFIPVAAIKKEGA